jgi:hypothetical protein
VNTLLTVLLALAIPAQNAETTASDDDALMRPTKHGIRMTPELSRAFSNAWLREETSDLELTEDEHRRLTEGLSKRLVELAHRRSATAQPFFEHLIETMMETGGRLDVERATEFGKRAAPMIPLSREFLQTTADEASRHLPPERLAEFERVVNRLQKRVDAWEKQMARWAEGGMQPGELPMQALESDAGSDEPDKSPAVRQAERRVRWQIRRLGTDDWGFWVTMVKSNMTFTEEQAARADAILARYLEESRAILTPEWQRRLRDNRLRHDLLNTIGQSGGPYGFRLEQEYEELARPIRELERRFHQEVLSLVTPEQRSAFMARVQEAAGAHGLKVEDVDATILMGEPAGS